MPLHPTEHRVVLDAILSAGVWEFGLDVFASGELANNKINMQKLLDNEELRSYVVGPMARIVKAANPDGLWGVPQGGQDLAELVAAEVGLPVVHLRKDLDGSRPGFKAFLYESDKDHELVEKSEVLVGLEDVTTEFTSVLGALAVADLRRKTKSIKAIWRRGEPSVEKSVGKPIEWLIEQPLPNMITPCNKFYRKYGHRAVGKLEVP